MSSLSSLVDFAYGVRPQIPKRQPGFVHRICSPNDELWYWLHDHQGSSAGRVAIANAHLGNVGSKLQTMRNNGRVRVSGEAGEFRYYAVRK